MRWKHSFVWQLHTTSTNILVLPREKSWHQQQIYQSHREKKSYKLNVAMLEIRKKQHTWIWCHPGYFTQTLDDGDELNLFVKDQIPRHMVVMVMMLRIVAVVNGHSGNGDGWFRGLMTTFADEFDLFRRVEDHKCRLILTFLGGFRIWEEENLSGSGPVCFASCSHRHYHHIMIKIIVIIIIIIIIS